MDFNIRNEQERLIICKNNEDSTWSFNDEASKYLEVGKLYTVIDVDVHDWHTRLTLKEFPNQQFNSVHFDEIIEDYNNCSYFLFDDDSNSYKCDKCRKVWTLMEGTFKDNGMKYCPKCGMEIKYDD